MPDLRPLTELPELLRSLDPHRNGDLDPRLIPRGSRKRLWWRCPEGPDHVWEAYVFARAHGSGCPFCDGDRVSVTNCLSTIAPGLAMDWHPTKNGKLTPDQVTKAYAHPVWWKCTEGRDHVWRALVNRRIRMDAGCPFCAGRRVSVTNRLSTVAPQLAGEWHPTKNGTLTPKDVVAGSNRRVWWQCPEGPDHVWAASPHTRRDHPLCPYCTNQRLSVTNRFSSVAPDVARQWHPTKNGELTPDDVFPGSHRRVWWRCPEGPDHVWQSRIARRVKLRRGCPFCTHARASATNSLATQRPDLAAQWHPTKNGKRTPHDVTPGSPRKVWWQCARDSQHEWQAQVSNRRKTRCPHCSHRVKGPDRLLANANPALAAMWHPTKNGELTPLDVMAGSRRRVFWKCPNGPDHEWQGSVFARSSRKNPCPFCAGYRVSVTNCLATLYPALALQWHSTRNGSLSPSQIHARSMKQVWWLCPAGHVWKSRVEQRTRLNMACPGCKRRKGRQALTFGEAVGKQWK